MMIFYKYMQMKEKCRDMQGKATVITESELLIIRKSGNSEGQIRV